MAKRKQRPLIFVSHASQDSWVAEQIAARIRRCGARTYLDVIDLKKGDDFDETLCKATREAKEAVLLLTPTAEKSKNVWVEFGAFWGQRKRVIVVLYGIPLSRFNKDGRTPMSIKKLQVVDINGLNALFPELRARLRANSGGR